MKERPILFSAPMIRALLDGRKTQTRRIVKGSVLPTHERGVDTTQQTIARTLRCPYGVVGGRLWVKETHRIESWDEDGAVLVSYAADDARCTVRACPWRRDVDPADLGGGFGHVDVVGVDDEPEWLKAQQENDR